VRRNTALDYALMTLALIGISIPSSYSGRCCRRVLDEARVLPRRGSRGSSYILPALTLGMIYIGTIARLTRGGLLETLGQISFAPPVRRDCPRAA